MLLRFSALIMLVCAMTFAAGCSGGSDVTDDGDSPEPAATGAEEPTGTDADTPEAMDAGDVTPTKTDGPTVDDFMPPSE